METNQIIVVHVLINTVIFKVKMLIWKSNQLWFVFLVIDQHGWRLKICWPICWRMESYQFKSYYSPKTTKPCKSYILQGFLFVWSFLLVTSTTTEWLYKILRILYNKGRGGAVASCRKGVPTVILTKLRFEN